jgi:hypothetical protein
VPGYRTKVSQGGRDMRKIAIPLVALGRMVPLVELHRAIGRAR